MEGLGFWIFMGLVLLAVILSASREKLEKQRTLQRMLERNEAIDEDLVKRLLGNPGLSRPGSAYRALRATGAFIMIVSIPVGGFAFAAVAHEVNTPMSGAVMAGATFFLMPFTAGLGLFVASRYCEKPDQGSTCVI